MPLVSGSLDDASLTQFGVALADEGPHAFDPSVEWWNESWFWDWIDASGQEAGHLRLGLHPNQGRAWLWLFVYREGEWLAVEETRLPLADLAPGRLAYDRFGLRFSYAPSAPLQGGRLRCEGFGRVVSGPRTGMVLPVAIDLEVTAQGPPHSGGRARAAGHESARFPASRFEQPIAVGGAVTIAGERRAFTGRGERDHSWGPRHWNLEWTFLALNGERLRMQWAEAVIAGAGRFVVGYLQRGAMESIATLALEVTIRDDDVLHPFSGHFSVETETGSRLAGRLESLTAAEIDITHTFVPPRRSLYRRALVRVHLDDGGPPLLGWLEANRLRDGAGA